MLPTTMMSKVLYFLKYRLNPAIWIPATVLCIRFPFLYPRNRFTGKHYTNWKLNSLQKDAYLKAYKVEGEFGNKDNPAHIVKVSKWWAFVEKFYRFIECCIGIFHAIPTYTELDALDSGWRKAFGIYICKDLKKALLADGGRKRLRQYRIDQIKEKYGRLCWYDHGGNEEVDKIITKYEYISWHTCIECGKPADYITKGWIEPYCKDCLPERYNPEDEKAVGKFYTEENPWYSYIRYSFKKKEETKDEKEQ